MVPRRRAVARSFLLRRVVGPGRWRSAPGCSRRLRHASLRSASLHPWTTHHLRNASSLSSGRRPFPGECWRSLVAAVYQHSPWNAGAAFSPPRSSSIPRGMLAQLRSSSGAPEHPGPTATHQARVHRLTSPEQATTRLTEPGPFRRRHAAREGVGNDADAPDANMLAGLSLCAKANHARSPALILEGEPCTQPCIDAQGRAHARSPALMLEGDPCAAARAGMLARAASGAKRRVL
jgi:hypothetical protein